jgi:hypothetical protein
MTPTSQPYLSDLPALQIQIWMLRSLDRLRGDTDFWPRFTNLMAFHIGGAARVCLTTREILIAVNLVPVNRSGIPCWTLGSNRGLLVSCSSMIYWHSVVFIVVHLEAECMRCTPWLNFDIIPWIVNNHEPAFHPYHAEVAINWRIKQWV